MNIIKEIIPAFIGLLFLSGCAAQSVSEQSSVSTQAESEYSKSDNAKSSESGEESERKYSLDAYPELFYGGVTYTCPRVYSSQTEVDGEFYEVDSGIAAYLDIQSMKEAGEYIGVTIPSGNYEPVSEMEMSSDIPFELYRIDDVTILAAATEPRVKNSESWVYSGKPYYENYIMLTDDADDLWSYAARDVVLKYYPWLSNIEPT